MFGAKYYAYVTRVPSSVLVPIIATLCILGAYTYRKLAADMIIVLIFGIIGYYMDRVGMPMAPFVLAFVLGRSAEIDLRRAVMIIGSTGPGAIFKPLPIALIIIDIAMLIWPFWGTITGKDKKKAAAAAAAAEEEKKG